MDIAEGICRLKRSLVFRNDLGVVVRVFAKSRIINVKVIDNTVVTKSLANEKENV